MPNVSLASLTFSVDSYSRLSLINFLFASFVCILREPSVFWSISKIFSFIYSFALLLNVIQWCLMYGAFQLLLKNICFNPIESRHRIGYLLTAQPYTAFFLYLLLEFLIYISSITFYYYAYNRFKYHDQKSTCYDRCSHYCPSLIAIILLLLYTSCKMPLVHDLFLLYLQTRLQLLFVTFVFEIVHILLILALWIFLTTKIDWHLKASNKQRQISAVSNHGLTVKNTPIQSTAISLPELSGTCSSTDKVSRRLSDNLYQKPYEKIRIFQSEIYYRNRPKNWSLPLNQQATMMATFDQDDDENDIVIRSPSYPVNPNQEVQYRDAIRKTVTSLYKLPDTNLQESESQTSQSRCLVNATPPAPPVKRFTKEQVEAARVRAQKLIVQRQRSPDYVRHQRSAALLISQVWSSCLFYSFYVNKNVFFSRTRREICSHDFPSMFVDARARASRPFADQSKVFRSTFDIDTTASQHLIMHTNRRLDSDAVDRRSTPWVVNWVGPRVFIEGAEPSGSSRTRRGFSRSTVVNCCRFPPDGKSNERLDWHVWRTFLVGLLLSIFNARQDQRRSDEC